MTDIHRFIRIVVATAILSLLAGCGEKPAGTSALGSAPPPQVVSVVAISPEDVAITTELPGRVEATRVAEVRARVAGIVLQRVFQEESEVQAGEVLFRIDPAPLQAAHGSAQAALAKAEAALTQATLKAQRYQSLVARNAISKQDYDDATAAREQAAADVAAAEAARQSARLNLDYATVTAPISGRIGRALVTEGALVGQGEATPLATIQQLDPVYVNLTQSSIDLLRLREAMASGQLKDAGQGQAKVTLVTEDGEIYPLTGTLLFSAMSVDASTGAVALRATFPNPDRFLLPGMFVRAHLEQAVAERAITVPQQAVLRSPQGASVMVVGPDGKVTVQPVKADHAQGDKWLISQGLKAGDRVIVEGLQKIKPGMAVKAVPWQGPVVADSGQPSAHTLAVKPAAATSAQIPTPN